ncbi:DUF1599 domain-containing protein [Porphyromonas sp.]|uniref:DUF1599 domain-containing protein n=1 Tax=Porphyromonas sp. TaxID=1924944 RepID=UPI0026DD60C5|nr:DUF1599 domain-containing protein [Porphyromonas sp.]MDO4770568.1 DUF1599 domain-containing protein [Porphyromonas sp.]
MSETSRQYDEVIRECRALFVAKLKDYGASWRIMRPTSMTDQIFIKVNRIRSIQDKGVSLVGDDIRGEFVAIINYGIMGLVQLEKGYTEQPEADEPHVLEWYDKYAEVAKDLMQSKNHDYDEAWRSMRIASLTDMILTKVFRTKQIEDHQGQTSVSEGIDANYLDMINYAVFALIRLNEERGGKV